MERSREELKMQLPSWWTAELITPTSEEHAAVDWDYDLDYAEHATQQSIAEHATQQSIAEHATQQSIAEHATQQSIAEHATQQSIAEHATQQSIAEHATQHSIAPAPEPAPAPATQAHRNINSSRHWGSKYSVSRSHKHTCTPSTGDSCHRGQLRHDYSQFPTNSGTQGLRHTGNSTD
jgi:hypothetical protein